MREAVYADIPTITENWQSSFGDERESVDFFVSHRFDKVTTLIFEKDGKIVSQLFLMSVTVCGIEGYYLYAAATDEKFRGHGIMASLLQYAKETAIKDGKEFIFLVPGTESLYTYYKKHGYERSFKKYTVTVDRDKLTGNGMFSKDLSDAKYFLKSFEGIVSWDEEAINYGLEEFKEHRGEVFTLKDKALLLVSEDEIYLLCEEENFYEGASILQGVSDSKEFNIVTSAPVGNKENAGMILKLTERVKNKCFDDTFVIFAKE